MKNNSKKILLSTIIFMTIITFVTLIDVKATTNSDIMSEEEMDLNWKQAELGNKISIFLKENNNGEYPSYYGGMYVTDNLKNLVIQIVEKNIPNEKTGDYDVYEKLLKMDDSIVIEYVNNSYNELKKVNDIVTKTYANNSNSYKNIASNYIDVINNKVEVELYDNSEIEHQKFIKNVLQFQNKSISNEKILELNVKDFVHFSKNTTINNTNATTIKSGGQIFLYPDDTSRYCSMGIRVKYKGNAGYITAGHCVRNVNSIPSGTVKLRQFYNYEKYDYAFIQTNSSYNTSNVLAYPSPDGSITNLGVYRATYVFPAGIEIAKSGEATKYTTGKVTGFDKTVYYRDVGMYISGLVASSVKSYDGDSGAPVFIPMTASKGGSRPLGVLSGGSLDGSEMFFTNIADMPGDLYTGVY